MSRFVEWWNSLSSGVRDGIIVGIVLAVGGTLWKFSGKLALGFARLTQRILNRALPLDKPKELKDVAAESKETQSLDKPLQSPQQSQDSILNVTLPASLIPKPPVVGFVARRDIKGRDILEQLKEELKPKRNQLIALCGAGGVGKTTLAAEAVRAVADSFVKRLAWVSADGRPEFNLSMLLDEVSAQLGDTDLRMLPVEKKEEQVRALVAAEPTLIVLDNFETVTDAEQMRCTNWLSRTPCSAIITSRDEVEQARPVNISAMSMLEARIFVKRLIAQARRPPAFKGLGHDSIIAAADRNPLVLQWIIRQIDRAKQPHVVLQELAQGEGDAAERVFGRSFDLLSEDSRAALLALSLFVPSASHTALAGVAGFGDDLKRLAEALAQSTELWLTSTTEGNKRLTIEGLTRELTKAKLSKDERATEYRQRFVAHFMKYAEAHAQKTAEDFDALEVEKDNVLSAMDAAFDLEDWMSVVQSRLALHGFLDLHGHWDEAIRSGKQALAAARHSQNESSVAALAHNLAFMNQRRGELEAARRLYDESLEITRKLDDQSSVAVTLHNLAVIAQDQGEIEEARRLYDESLETKRRLGDQSGIATTLHQLAMLAQNQGEIKEARRLYDESLEIEKKLGDQSGIANTLHNLAAIAQDQGEIEEARRLYDESLEIEKKLGDRSGIASILHQLGRLAQTQGEIKEARRLYDESLETKRRLGDQGGIAITLHQLGRLAQTQGEIKEARRLYDESLEIKRKLGNQGGIANTLHQLGRLAEVENNRGEAMRLFREALGIWERLKSPDAEIARRSLRRVETEAS